MKRFEELRTKQPFSYPEKVLKSLELPQIVIIGMENAGKSSTLERILGVEVLPRAPGFCTRIAVKIKLLHEPTCVEPRLNLILPKLGVNQNGQRYDFYPNVTCKEVADRLQQLNQDIKSRKLGILMDSFATLELTSKDVPSLNLVDLPGVITVRLPSDDEPPNLAEMSEELTRMYLNQKETGGVLCVVDAAMDNLRASKAIRLLQDCRPDLQPNAVVVMTKPDKSCDLNWEDEGKNGPLWLLEDRLFGKSADYIPVRGGYVALKNRSTESRNQRGFHGQNEEEIEWFMKNCSFNSGFFANVDDTDSDSTRQTKKIKLEGNQSNGDQHKQPSFLGSRHLGILALIKKLDWMISQFLKRDWVPGKLTEQEGEAEKLRESLAPLGLAPEEIGIERLKKYSYEKLLEAFKPQLLDELCTVSCEGLAESTISNLIHWETVTQSHPLLQEYIDAIESGSILRRVGTGIEALVSKCFERDQTGEIKLSRFPDLQAMLVSELHIMMQDDVYLNAFKRNALERCNLFLNTGCSFQENSGWTLDFNNLRVRLRECVMVYLLMPVLHATNGIVPATFKQLNTMPPESETMAALRADIRHQLENVELIKSTLRGLTEV